MFRVVGYFLAREGVVSHILGRMQAGPGFGLRGTGCGIGLLFKSAAGWQLRVAG